MGRDLTGGCACHRCGRYRVEWLPGIEMGCGLAKQYNLAVRTTVLAQEKSTLAGQARLFDITTFNGWVAARVAGNEKLAAYYQRRFRPEYVTAFVAWQKLDPFNNSSVPPGPSFMTE